MGRRVDPQQMAQWLSRREHERWSLAELSRRSGHPTWKLRWWEKRLERTREAGRPPARAFIAVEVAEPKPETVAALELVTRSGYRLYIPGGFDADHLRSVLEVLDREC